MSLKDALRRHTPLRLRILFGPIFAYTTYIYRMHIHNDFSDIKVLSLLKTIEIIKNKKMSAIRYGDGEMSLIYNENLGFQKNNINLSQRLRTILQTNNTKLIICIPGIWGNINNFSKRSFWFTLHHLFKFGYRWKSLLQKDQTYGDAFITRPYLNYKDEKAASDIFSAMQSIWSGESVTLIEGSKSRLGVGNDLFNNTKSIKRILCPSENAYEKYEQIKEESLKIDKNELVLLSLGPTAKVLAYDLFLEGYRVIDIGHIDMEYEMFLRGSKELVEVPYKYFNEIEARNPEDCKDPVYLSQIIARIE